MNAKHTKGEWGLINNPIALNSFLAVGVKQPNGKHILICEMVNIRGDNYEDNSQFIEANARLIAAAPELLDALILLLNKYEFNLSKNQKANLHLDEEYILARKAIKKAQGE